MQCLEQFSGLVYVYLCPLDQGTSGNSLTLLPWKTLYIVSLSCVVNQGILWMVGSRVWSLQDMSSEHSFFIFLFQHNSLAAVVVSGVCLSMLSRHQALILRLVCASMIPFLFLASSIERFSHPSNEMLMCMKAHFLSNRDFWHKTRAMSKSAMHTSSIRASQFFPPSGCMSH